MKRLKGSSAIITLLALVACLSWTQETTPSAPTPPVAQTELQESVDALHRLLDEQNYDAVIEQGSTLRSRAQQAGDRIAEAYALRALALALQRQNRSEDSIKTWSQAAALWNAIGDTPYEVEALLSELWLRRSEPEEQGQAILPRVLQAAQRKTNRPTSLSNILLEYAVRFYHEKRLDIAYLLVEQAIKTRSAVAPEAKELATAYHLLGEIHLEWRNLSEAKQAYERALHIMEKTELRNCMQVKTLSNLASVEERLRQYATALEYARAAVRLAEELNEPPQTLAALLAQTGFLHYRLNQYEQAETLIQQALEMCLRHPEIDRRLLVEIYQLLANRSLERSQIDKAINYAHRAWELQEQINPASIEAARILSLKATLYLQKYDLRKGIEYAERAWEIAQRHEPNLHSQDMVEVLVAVATARLAQMRFNDALELLGKAREIALNHGDFKTTALILSLLRQLSRLTGRTEQAQRYQRELDALGQPDLLDPIVQIFTLTTQVQTAINDGDYFTAIHQASRALELCRHTEGIPMVKHQELVLIMLLGHAYARLGDFPAALNAFTTAYELCKKPDYPPLMLAGIETNLGGLYMEMGRYDEALRLLTAARERLGEILDYDALACLINLGNYYLWRGEYDKAHNEFKRVADWLREHELNTPMRMRLMNTLGYLELLRGDLEAASNYIDEAIQLYHTLQVSTPDLIILKMNRARVHRARGDRLSAERVLEEAAQFLDTQRGKWLDPEVRTLFTEQYGDVYVLQAQLYLQSGDYARAAEALECSRARTLSEQIQARQAAFQSDDETLRPLLQEMEQVRREQQRVVSRLTAARFGTSEWAQLQQQRETANLRYQSLLQQLQRVSPRHYELLTPSPPRIDQIQRALEPGTVLLYYGVAQEELLIVAVTPNSVHGYTQPVSASRLTQLANRFRSIVGTPPAKRTAPDRREMLALGKQLYDYLVRPAETVLKNAKRVVLCPMGSLNLLPWAALVVEGDSLKNAVYWVEKTTIHLTPSMGVYLQARQVAPIRERAVVAALGYADLKNASIPLVSRGEYATQIKISPLPSAEQEAKAIARHMGEGVRVLLNESATPETMRTEAQRAGVVHFTCHAFASAQDPYSSVLLLAPPLQETGLLRAADIMDRWHLQADLVMLAACDSTQGVVRRYEGVFGLARAFLFAGTRTVGATLWQIGDEATYLLMDTFYTHYARGAPKDEALRKAQRAVRKSESFSDPYFWSGFVLIGDYQNKFAAPRSRTRQ